MTTVAGAKQADLDSREYRGKLQIIENRNDLYMLVKLGHCVTHILVSAKTEGG